MELRELTRDEQLVLVGLARLIVHADQQVTSDEAQALATLADHLGREVWNARVQEARDQLPTAAATWALAETLTRPDANARILETLQGLASSDETSEPERAILDFLEGLWFDEDPDAPDVDLEDDDSTEFVLTEEE